MPIPANIVAASEMVNNSATRYRSALKVILALAHGGDGAGEIKNDTRVHEKPPTRYGRHRRGRRYEGQAMRRRGLLGSSLRLRSALSLRWPCPAVGGGLRPPLVFYGLMGGGIRKDPRSGGLVGGMYAVLRRFCTVAPMGRKSAGWEAWSIHNCYPLDKLNCLL